MTKREDEIFERRIGRGIYALPIQGRFGPRPPSTASVVEAIESATGETVVASGAAEANSLGLTTQLCWWLLRSCSKVPRQVVPSESTRNL